MKKHQRGVTVVEFALIVVAFFTLLLGITDFGRLMFIWNAAQEATRVGVRMAVVCAPGFSPPSNAVALMQTFVPNLQTSNIEIDWYEGNSVSSTCGATKTCTGAAVYITGLEFEPISPWTGFTSITIPDFKTYLPSEAMGGDVNSSAVCS